jgi:hypothetical protein
VKETTTATSKLPKIGLPSRRPSSKKTIGLVSGPTCCRKRNQGKTGAPFTLLALTLAAVNN